MSDDPGLFDLDAEPGPRLSADARRTARQRAAVAAGWHPLTGDRARPDLGTCGDCAHRVGVGGGRSYPKCKLGPITRGPATDVRAWWPGCPRFAPRVDTPTSRKTD